MKLHKLSAARFGGLQGPLTLMFDGASCLIQGSNEAGKTSFIDALRTALYGPPERGRSTAEGKTFASRYGDDYAVEAEWLTPQGGVRRSTPDNPTGHEDIARELFTSLFLLKGGECTLHGKDKLEAGFGPKFAKAVLGAGEVDLEAAVRLLQKISDPKGSTKWSKLDKKLKEELASAEAKLSDLGRLAELCRKRDKADASAEELHARLKAAEAELKAAESGSDKLEAEDLSSDRARWENALREEERSRFPAGSPSLSDLEALSRAEAEAAKSAASLEARLSDKRSEASRHEDGLASLKTRAESLPDKVLREKLRLVLKELGSADVSGPKAYPPVLDLLVPLIAAGLGLAMGWMLKGKAGAAVGLVVCAILGWLALSLFKAGRSRPGESRSAQLKELKAVAAGLGWPDDPAQCGRKLSEADADESRVKAETRTRREDLESFRTQLRSLEAELAKAKTASCEAASLLSKALSSCGTASIKDTINRKAVWEGHRSTAKLLEDSLRGRLGIPASVPVSELKTKLQARIAELKEAVPVNGGEVKRENLRAKLDSCRSLRERLLKDLEAGRKTAEASRLEAGQLQASIGGDEAAILSEAHRARLRVEDLGSWRKAAEEACSTVRRLSADTGKRMAELVADASPLFSGLTSGRYTGLELKGASIFEEEALAAVHAALGPKPVEWLSRGTQDLLWLCLRISLCRRILPQGGLLVLDEPFLTLDPGRASKAFAALFSAGQLKDWQVLVLTKDPAFTDLAQSAGVKAAVLS
ncbi:MAG: AAA family ATPase [Elusimicrobiota bacterium]